MKTCKTCKYWDETEGGVLTTFKNYETDEYRSCAHAQMNMKYVLVGYCDSFSCYKEFGCILHEPLEEVK